MSNISFPEARTRMDSATTRLLVAAKQMVETLIAWSEGKVDDNMVSDVYVKLGNDFNMAAHMFGEYDVDMSDLLPIPEELREHLESCLGNDPSPESLSPHMEPIRGLVTRLMVGLQHKQMGFSRRMQQGGGGNGTGAESMPSMAGGGGMGNGSGVGGGGMQASGSMGNMNIGNGGGGPGVGGSDRIQSRPSFSSSLNDGENGADRRASVYSNMERVQLADPGVGGSSGSLNAKTPRRSPSPTPSSSSRSARRESASSTTAPTNTTNQRNGSMGYQSRVNARVGAPLPPAPPDAFRPPRQPGGGGGRTPSPTPPQQAVARMPEPRPFSPPAAGPGAAAGVVSVPAPLPSPTEGLMSAASGGSGLTTTTTARPHVPPKSGERTVSGKIIGPRDRVVSQSSVDFSPPVTPPRRVMKASHPAMQSIQQQHNVVSGSGGGGHGHQLGSRFSLDSEVDTPESSIGGRGRESMRDSARDSVMMSHMGSVEEEGSRQSSPPSRGHDHGRGHGRDDGDGPASPPYLPPISLGALSSPISGIDADDSSRHQSFSAAHTQQPYPPPPPPPPPEPAQTQAALASLTALQNSEALGRRASRRFSQYHIKQMLPGQHRGPSSSALRHGHLQSLSEAPPGPGRPARRNPPPPVPPLPDIPVTPPYVSEVGDEDAGERRNPERSRRSSVVMPRREDDIRVPELALTEDTPTKERRERPSSMIIVPDEELEARLQPSSTSDGVQEVPAPPTTDLTESPSSFKVFLQFGRETKRVVLDRELTGTIVELQGLFMSKFDYAPEGLELFPDVYIKDPVTGVAYHLEEMEDIKPNALLSLNLDPLDQVKQHFDNTITSLSHEIKDLKNSFIQNRRASMLKVDAPSSLAAERSSPILRPTERGRAASPVPPVRLARPADVSPGAEASPAGDGAVAAAGGKFVGDKGELRQQFDEVQNLRRELGTMRQVYLDFVGQTKSTFQVLRNQTLSVREVALSKLGGSRALVNTGKESLEKQSSDTVQVVEDVSDVVDTIKEDVLKRQIMPRKAQMDSMQNNLAKAQEQVTKFREQITLAAPTWKQTWNQELRNVLDEQHLLQYQEKLVSDLEEDVKQASDVFETLQEYVKQRQAGVRTKSASKKYPGPLPAEDGKTSVSHLLLEIRTQEQDPNKRLAAIEQQQRLREKEKEGKNANDEFANELTGFVSGKKLKRTGGTEEIERVRLKKQEQNLKRMFSGDVPPSGSKEKDESVSTATPPASAARADTPIGEKPEAGDSDGGAVAPSNETEGKD